MKTVTKSEEKRCWSHFIGLKSLWAYLSRIVASFECTSAGFERKTLAWYFGKVLDSDNKKKFYYIWNEVDEAWILKDTKYIWMDCKSS